MSRLLAASPPSKPNHRPERESWCFCAHVGDGIRSSRFRDVPAAPAAQDAEMVRLICDYHGRCYRSRRHIPPGYFTGYPFYSYGPDYCGYGLGYYGYGPGIAFGLVVMASEAMASEAMVLEATASASTASAAVTIIESPTSRQRPDHRQTAQPTAKKTGHHLSSATDSAGFGECML